MNRMKKTIIVSIISMVALISNANAGGHSGQAITHASKSISHASSSVGHSIVASGKVGSAVIAVPFAIVGSAGEVSNKISNNLIDLSTTPFGEPLEISDESFIVGPPPSKAINLTNNKEKK